MADNDNPAGEALLHWREQLLKGESIYGDPNSHIAKEKLAEYDARIAYARSQGTIPPNDPWTPEKVAREELAKEFRGGDPAIEPEYMAERHAVSIEAVAALDDRTYAARADDLAEDLEHNTSRYSLPFSVYNRETNARPTGRQIRSAMLASAEHALNVMPMLNQAAARRALGADRKFLEYMATKGAAIAAFAASKARKNLL